MQAYRVRDIQRVLHLPRSVIRSLVGGGLVKPARGPRREYRFSFRDLVLMRTAGALRPRVPARRLQQALRTLRRRLPDGVPLSGLSLRAVGDRVVVRDGPACWDVDDGQYLLGFEPRSERLEPPAAVEESNAAGQPLTALLFCDNLPDSASADIYLEHARSLEYRDTAAALQAYRRAAELDAQLAPAWINWGRLLHEQGATGQAENVYRRGLEHCANSALLWFNLGVLLEDLKQHSAAFEAYQQALRGDPELADAHYNLARLCEARNQMPQAIRHLAAYRRLTGEPSR